MRIIPRESLSVLVGVLLLQVGSETAAECTIEVTEDLMRPLLSAPSPSWRCCELWNNLLLQFHYTRRNLTACEQHEETAGTPEPSYAFCQLMLDNVRADLEGDRRMHEREMTIRVQVAQMEIRKQEQEKQAMGSELVKMNNEWRPLYLELLLTNIGMGYVRQALKYYHLYLEGNSPDTLHGPIIQWVYRDPKRENQRLDNLFTFVRHLPGKAVKLALYRLIKPEILKRPGQREGYVAAVAGLDAARIVFEDDNQNEYHLYTDLYEPVEKRWKSQVVAGKYEELIAFATSHPMHYGEVENSFSTFKPEEWKKLNLNQFITFPNRLPLAKQRLEALLMILLQLKERNQSDFKNYLVKLAGEVDICEALVKKSKDSDSAQDKLAEVKRKFLEIDGNNDYEYYLRESKKGQSKSG
uniref:Uncharacterized protein n=1 Tax=Anopheles atroparvus TaxID=41427 RepID=A0AAG5DI64_ANOAO